MRRWSSMMRRRVTIRRRGLAALQVALFLVLCVTVAGERAVMGCKSHFLSFSVSLQKRRSLAVAQQAAHFTFFVTSWSFLVHCATGQTDSTSWRLEGGIEFFCTLVSVCEHKKRLLSARGAHVYSLASRKRCTNVTWTVRTLKQSTPRPQTSSLRRVSSQGRPARC